VPRVLVTNDDGIDSPGLHALAAAAVRAGLEVIVAAPAEQSSGAGAALTATRHEGRTIVERRELPGLDGVEAWAVQAQPGHIVVAALNGWFDPAPDVVLSGINHGANVGRAVLHSGTVGAALTAGISDVRGLAVSLDVALHPTGERYWVHPSGTASADGDHRFSTCADDPTAAGAPERRSTTHDAPERRG